MLVAWLTLCATGLFAFAGPMIERASIEPTIQALPRTSAAAPHLEGAAAEAEDEGGDEDTDATDGDEEGVYAAWSARHGAAERARLAQPASSLALRGSVARAPDDPATASIARPPDC